MKFYLKMHRIIVIAKRSGTVTEDRKNLHV